MTVMLYRDNAPIKQDSNPIFADFLMPDRDIKQVIKRSKPKKPETRKEPLLEQPVVKMTSSDLAIDNLSIEVPAVVSDINISMTMPEASTDSDYVPVLKVAPIYPQRAANRNIEGYVIVEYSISSSGQVVNVKVIESKPSGIFDKSAIEAAKRFKYKPRKVDGVNVAVDGVKNKFTFVLENQ